MTEISNILFMACVISRVNIELCLIFANNCIFEFKIEI